MNRLMAKGYPKPKKFTPLNPHKYIGDPNRITTRSSWETKFLNWADQSTSIIAYGSEEIVVPYLSPLDNKMHRYFTDGIIVTKNKNGQKVVTIIEIKPWAQTQPPILKKGRRKETVVNEAKTYAVNTAKWEAARAYCEKRGWKFMILTERELHGVKIA